MNRIIFLDYARAFALFIVVFAHLYSVDSDVKLYAYAFHMPLFFLISGYLHKDAETIPLIKKMAKRMLIPFCFFLFIGYLFCVISSKSLAIGTAHASVKGIVLGQDIAANDILWFLLALFSVRIIGNAFIRKPLKYGIPSCIIFFVMLFFHINFLYLGTSMMALPFYLLGYYGKDKIDVLVHNKYSIIISIICLACTIILSNFNGKVSMMGMSFGNTSFEWLNILLFYLNGIIGTLMVLCFSGMFKKEARIVSLVSKCSISIVGIQFIPIMIWISKLGFNQSYGISILYSFAIIICSVVFHLIIEKKANWLLGGK
jgi:fucose 4-O-acetylase-like acetyltransferase